MNQPVTRDQNKVKVVVIVVNWNGKQHLIECLKSLALQEYHNFSVVVVDNGSDDGSIEWMQKTYPNMKLFKLKNNLGFAKANNVGMEWALKQDADAIALLNNDCEASPEWLSHLVSALKQDDLIGACAAQMLFAQDSDIVNGLGLYLTDLGFSGDNYRGNSKIISHASEEVIGFSGGACLIRAEVLKRVGFFDPYYFMYVEDLDLSLRILLSGYRIKTVPCAIVRHRCGATASKLPHLVQYYGVRNRYYFMAKFFSGMTLFRMLCFGLFIDIYRMIVHFLTGKIILLFYYLRAFFRGWFEVMKSQLRFRQLVLSTHIRKQIKHESILLKIKDKLLNFRRGATV